MQYRLTAATILSLAVLVAAGCTHHEARSAAPGTTPMHTGSALATPRLYDGFGNYQRKVSTSNPEAQRYFNQAMQFLYGYNHDEAIRSFQRAAALDDRLGIAWWGIAYAHGLHINNPTMTEQQSKLAYEAAQQALRRVDGATPAEKSLILAVSKRYAMPIPENRKHLDEAYADAMRAAWKSHGNDPDIGALYAESMMNRQPWDLWTKDFKPKGRALEIQAVLERVIQLDNNHPGANHFYIHTMEASSTPEKALPSADRLRTLVPGSGHLVHMPAHIYARVGRWGDASDANVAAIQADRAYFAKAPKPDFYSLYYVHNLHFLAWAAMMEGRYAASMQACNELQRDIPRDFLKDFAFIADGFMPVKYHCMIRFGKWDDILKESMPEDWRYLSVASLHYARGVAFAAKGNIAEARKELAAFEMAAKAIPENWMVMQNKASDVMAVAHKMLQGEIAFRERKSDEAFKLLREGVALEDNLNYDEPPAWMQPVRHALGALLLADNRAKEAEKVYREDLARYPENGWALLGLRQSLEAQTQQQAADATQQRFVKAWSRADVKPVASCYCHPHARAE